MQTFRMRLAPADPWIGLGGGGMGGGGGGGVTDGGESRGRNSAQVQARPTPSWPSHPEAPILSPSGRPGCWPGRISSERPGPSQYPTRWLCLTPLGRATPTVTVNRSGCQTVFLRAATARQPISAPPVGEPGTRTLKFTNDRECQLDSVVGILSGQTRGGSESAAVSRAPGHFWVSESPIERLPSPSYRCTLESRLHGIPT